MNHRKFSVLMLVCLGILLPARSINAIEATDIVVGKTYAFKMITTNNYDLALHNGETMSTSSNFQGIALLKVDDYTSEDGNLSFTSWNSYDGEEYNTWINISTAINKFSRLFSTQYYYDSETEQFVLLGITTSFYSSVFFITPDWASYNEIFLQTTFNESVLIQSDFTGTGQEILMGDFLQQCESYTMMGKSSIEDAINSITNTTRKWSASFELGNNVFFRKWDPENRKYTNEPYSSYRYSFSLEYSAGGSLLLYTYTNHYSRNTTSGLITSSSSYEIKPSSSSDLSPSFSISFVILTLFIILVLARKLGYKRNR